MTDSPARPPSLADRVMDHLGLIVSAAALAFIALRILAVAGWNVDTATAIIQRGGAANVTLATVVSSLPLLVNGLAGLAAGATARRIYLHEDLKSLLWAVVPLLVAALFFVSLAMTSAFLLLPLVGRLLRPREDRESTKGVDDAVKTVATASFAAVTTVLVLAFATVPYLPLEELQLPDEVRVGYVIGEDPDRIYFLTPGPATRIASTPRKHLERRLCQRDKSWYSLTVTDLVNGQRYPACPDSTQ